MNIKHQYDVFLSFASKNEILARDLWDEMSRSGLRVFWSDETLKNNIGESFFTAIQSALQHSKNFVLLCTEEAMLSNWVREEYESFYSNCYIPSGRKRKFIIYQENSCKNKELPLLLKNIQATDSVELIIKTLGGNNYMELARENQTLKEKLKETKNKLDQEIIMGKELSQQVIFLKDIIESLKNIKLDPKEQIGNETNTPKDFEKIIKKYMLSKKNQDTGSRGPNFSDIFEEIFGNTLNKNKE